MSVKNPSPDLNLCYNEKMRLRSLFIAICLFSFGSELALDGSTAFVRTDVPASVGKLVISSINPSENKDLPQDSSPEVPDWAKTPPQVHSASFSKPLQLPFSLLVFTAPLFQAPEYRDPFHPLLHRPPITSAA